MSKENIHSRRKFIMQSSLASAALFVPGQQYANQLFSETPPESNKLHVSLFSKHLQFLNYNDMSEATKTMGFDGIDLTVRPKGHVLPENVAEDLPRVTAAMKKHGLDPIMFSSNVIDVNNTDQMNVLKVASELGYQYYRPAWIKYDVNKPILAQVAKADEQFTSLVKVNKELDLSASYHNHSGNYFGGPIWDLHQVISTLPKDQFGAQYDIMHAKVEGGKSWEASLNLILPYANTLVVKDCIWGMKNGKWDRINVPMGEGMVDFKKYFSILKKNNINIPISIHVEHDLGGAEHGGNPTIEHKEVFKRIKKDLDFLRNTWKSVQ